MSFLKLYARVLSFLSAVLPAAITLVIANFALAFAQFAEPMLFGKVIDQLAAGVKDWRDVAPLVAAWGGLGVFSILAGVLVSLFADRLSHRRRVAAMAAYYEHVMRLSALYHARSHSGRLLKVMIEGANAMFVVWLNFFRMHCVNFASLFVMLPITLFLNFWLGVILIVLVAFFAIAMNLVIRQSNEMQDKANAVATNLAERVSDALANLAVVQSFNRIEGETRDFEAVSEKMLRAQLPVLTWWAINSVATRTSATVTLFAIFAAGIWLDLQGQTTVGQIVGFMSLATGLVGRLEQTVGFVNFLFGQAPQMREFFEVMDEVPTVKDLPGARGAGRLRGEVAFENVSFAYVADRPALDGVSFTARAGQTVALVGATGSGKSTALALLTRTFDPKAGRVTIDGADIREFTLASLRANIGVVFQEPLLLARSIDENLRIGKPDATAAEIDLALEGAQAADFVRRLPEGLAAIVGERGRNLSGGERQRLSIARALLKDPPILVLDEATSALDATTEAKLQQALDSARRGRTTFVIAHRLATIRNADVILVFDRGRIVEWGGFDALVAEGGVFARLAEAQFMVAAP